MYQASGGTSVINIQQRMVQCCTYYIVASVLALCLADKHHCYTAAAHDGLDISIVQVDQ